jgi:hypothetical protein
MTVAALEVALIDASFAGDVKTMTNDLNNAVKAGIPVNAKVKAMVPPQFFSADIQNTAVGGCPHPSDRGHTKLADTLSATYAGM